METKLSIIMEETSVKIISMGSLELNILPRLDMLLIIIMVH